jgi:glutaredoxin
MRSSVCHPMSGIATRRGGASHARRAVRFGRAVLVGLALVVSLACDREADPPEPVASDEAAAGTAPDVTPPDLGAGATVYTWYDARGIPHLAGRIEDVPPDARDRVVVSRLDGASDPFESERIVADLRDGQNPSFSRIDLGRLAEPGPKSDEALLAHEAVYVYTTPWCGFCKRAIAYLEERGVPFEERDIEANPRFAAELRGKARAAGVRAQGVPVLDVHGTLIVGFNRPALDEALKTAGYAPGEPDDG